MWCGRVSPGVPQRLEARASLANSVKDIEQVPGRAGQPVKPRHDQHIALIEPLDQLGKLGSVAPSAANLLRIDFGAASRTKLWVLGGQGLAPGRHPRVAVNRHSRLSLLGTIFA